MEDSSGQIRRSVREYILREFLPGEDPESLRDDTPLITGGVLDSISFTKLVVFLEEAHAVEFQANEITMDCMNTVDHIVRLIRTKTDAKA